MMQDLLWADPDRGARGWLPNNRGCSYVFGQVKIRLFLNLDILLDQFKIDNSQIKPINHCCQDVVRDFCQRFGIDLVVRAHQVVQDGYEFFAGRKLVTIFRWRRP